MLLSPLREQDLAPSLGPQPAARSREAWGHITLRGREARSTPRFQLIKTKREWKLIAELNGVIEEELNMYTLTKESEINGVRGKILLRNRGFN